MNAQLHDSGVVVGYTEPETDIIQERVVKHRPRVFWQVLLYVLFKVQDKKNVEETVLQKLLYFIDFDYYEKYEENLMGETYIKARRGPINRRLRPVLNQLQQEGVVEKVIGKCSESRQVRYRPVSVPNWDDLESRDLEHIDEVLDRLSGLNAAKIREYSHDDIPWKCTLPDRAIPYELVFYRDSPYSVREYTDDI